MSSLSSRLADQRTAKKLKQQARQQNKVQAQKLDKSAASLAVNTLLVKKSFEAQPEQAITLLMQPAWAAMQALSGSAKLAPWLDMDGFITLNEINILGFCLAKRLYEFGTDGTKAAVISSKEIFEAAADALACIGERYAAKNKFGATGDETKALRESMHWVNDLLAVSTQGHTMTALIEAKTMVSEQLKANGVTVQ